MLSLAKKMLSISPAKALSQSSYLVTGIVFSDAHVPHAGSSSQSSQES